ncbi:hypothetical protein D3C79_912870 [compost metagenome]
MVRTDKINHSIRNTVFNSYLYPIRYVPDDDPCTFFVSKLIMRVSGFLLVLDKIVRSTHFTNIMIQCTSSHQ